MSVFATQQPYQTTGAITATGQTISLFCPGATDAIINVVGTFTGNISFRGSSNNTNIGSRRMHKTGVGSLGVSTMSGTGSAVDLEYRIVAGGNYVYVTSTGTWTGTANITITADTNPSIVFINGAVHTEFDEALRAGRAYSASTGVQSVTNGNYLKYIFSNPSNSGVNCFIARRTFYNNFATGNVPPEANQVQTPTAMTTPTTVTPGNQRNGGGASAITFNWKMEGTVLTGSGSTSALILTTGGQVTTVDSLRMIVPGESFGWYIGGAGGGLATTARLAANVVWYEEPVS